MYIKWICQGWSLPREQCHLTNRTHNTLNQAWGNKPLAATWFSGRGGKFWRWDWGRQGDEEPKLLLVNLEIWLLDLQCIIRLFDFNYVDCCLLLENSGLEITNKHHKEGPGRLSTKRKILKDKMGRSTFRQSQKSWTPAHYFQPTYQLLPTTDYLPSTSYHLIPTTCHLPHITYLLLASYSGDDLQLRARSVA